ncbi:MULTISPECIES: hypothetical protein [unclassified Burkholderia]|uniref:hypothetical protein n=1 Tax=unclassified Burkholderia TaxID=2613784 RepID=UPI0021AB9667|nr:MULTISPECIES: hypothetical protein [unclassified Burkholderia]
MSELAPRFGSNRMLREYLDGFYWPAAVAYRDRLRDGGKLARVLAEWEATLGARWHEVHFGSMSVRCERDAWHICVPVYLGEVPAEWGLVEFYADTEQGQPAECALMSEGVPIAGAIQRYLYHGTLAARRPAEHYTPRVRVARDGVFVPAELSLIAWYR